MSFPTLTAVADELNAILPSEPTSGAPKPIPYDVFSVEVSVSGQAATVLDVQPSEQVVIYGYSIFLIGAVPNTIQIGSSGRLVHHALKESGDSDGFIFPIPWVHAQGAPIIAVLENSSAVRINLFAKKIDGLPVV